MQEFKPDLSSTVGKILKCNEYTCGFMISSASDHTAKTEVPPQHRYLN